MNRLKALAVSTIVATFFLLSSSASNAQLNFSNPGNEATRSSGIKIILVSPPGVFLKPGSETTNFVQVCSLSEAINIVLDDVGENKIEFKEPIVNMCDNNKIENLDQYVQLDKPAEVTVNSNLAPQLNKPAEITMRNLPFDEEPAIEVDGKKATEKDVENKVWDQNKKTLKFTAKHFTTYKAVAQNTPTTPTNSTPTVKHNLVNSKNLLLLGLSSLFILLLMLTGSIFIFKLRKKKTSVQPENTPPQI